MDPKEKPVSSSSIEYEQCRLVNPTAPAASANTPPILMPGSGIGLHSIEAVVRALYPLGIKEYHLSAGAFDESEVSLTGRRSKAEEFAMGDWKVWRTRAEVIRGVRDLAERVVASLEQEAVGRDPT